MLLLNMSILNENFEIAIGNKHGMSNNIKNINLTHFSKENKLGGLFAAKCNFRFEALLCMRQSYAPHKHPSLTD